DPVQVDAEGDAAGEHGDGHRDADGGQDHTDGGAADLAPPHVDGRLRNHILGPLREGLDARRGLHRRPLLVLGRVRLGDRHGCSRSPWGVIRLRRVGAGARPLDDQWLPGMAHAAFVRSPVARARILSIETAAARALPGVRAVYTADDLNHLTHEMWSSVYGKAAPGPPPRALAQGDVRYVGEPVAIVVAESRYLAEDACDLVEVEYDPQPPVIGYETALADAEVVHPELGTNVASQMPGAPSDIDEVFAAAPHGSTGSLAGRGSLIFPGPYRLPKFRFRNTALYTNTGGRGPYRGPWMIESLAREVMMDVVARRMGIDPLELRRRNVIHQSELP